MAQAAQNKLLWEFGSFRLNSKPTRLQTVKFPIKGQLMERIIRKNAVKTSSQPGGSEMSHSDFPSYYDFLPFMASIYDGSILKGVTPTNSDTAVARTPQTAIKNTGNRTSAYLQTLSLLQPSRGVGHLFVVWASMPKIEPVSHVQKTFFPHPYQIDTAKVQIICHQPRVDMLLEPIKLGTGQSN